MRKISESELDLEVHDLVDAYAEYVEYIEEKENEDKIEKSATEENGSIEVPYFYQEEYEVYEGYRDSLKLSRDKRNERDKRVKSNIKRMDVELAEQDIYGKFKMVGLSEEKCMSVKLNNKVKSVKRCTPNSLKTAKYITTKQYAMWKKFIQNSVFSQAFGTGDIKFVFHGIDQMLHDTRMVILLLDKMIKLIDEDNDIYEEDDIYGEDDIYFGIIAQKALDAYSNGKGHVGLDKNEKYFMVSTLVGEDSYDYFDVGIFKYRNNKECPDNLQQLKKDIHKESENIEKQFVEKVEKYIDNSNVNSEKYEFAAFLAPIIAAICESYEENPLTVEKSVWAQKIPLVKLNIPDYEPEEQQQLSSNYSILAAYCDYLSEINEVASRVKYMEYQCFCNLIIYKIMTNNPITGEDVIIQLYAMEHVLGMQFLETISYKIYEYMSRHPEEIEKDLNGRYRFLAILIGKAYKCHSVISRISIAERVVDTYFKICIDKEDQDLWTQQSHCKDIIKMIGNADKGYKAFEALYLSDEEACKRLHKVSELEDSLAIYSTWTEYFKEKQNERDGRKQNEEKEEKEKKKFKMRPERKSYIKKWTREKVDNDNNFGVIIIKNWLLREIICGTYYPEIVIKD